MLRACRRVLRRDGRLVFTSIELAPALSSSVRRKARAAAPSAAATRRPYPRLLRSSGFAELGAHDVTAEYLETTRAWLQQSERHMDALTAVDGEAVMKERTQGWRDAIAALEAGWLRRTLYWAARG